MNCADQPKSGEAATPTKGGEPDTTPKALDSGTKLSTLTVSQPRQAKPGYAIAIADKPGKRSEYIGIQK